MESPITCLLASFAFFPSISASFAFFNSFEVSPIQFHVKEPQCDYSGTNLNVVDDIPILEGMKSPKEISNQMRKGVFSQGGQISNPEVHNVSNKVSTQDHELVAPEGFQVEGLSPQEMAKVQSVLECLEIKIVKEDQEVSTPEGRVSETQDKVYARRKKKEREWFSGIGIVLLES